MELWIRSQDKRRLMKANNIYLDEEIEYDNRKYAIKCGTIDIGYYTFYSALEILNEIQNILMSEPLVIIGSNEEKIEYKELSTYVYQMPKE